MSILSKSNFKIYKQLETHSLFNFITVFQVYVDSHVL